MALRDLRWETVAPDSPGRLKVITGLLEGGTRRSKSDKRGLGREAEAGETVAPSPGIQAVSPRSSRQGNRLSPEEMPSCSPVRKAWPPGLLDINVLQQNINIRSRNGWRWCHRGKKETTSKAGNSNREWMTSSRSGNSTGVVCAARVAL